MPDPTPQGVVALEARIKRLRDALATIRDHDCFFARPGSNPDSMIVVTRPEWPNVMYRGKWGQFAECVLSEDDA